MASESSERTFLSMVLPGKRARKSRFLQTTMSKFFSEGRPHYSPSGMTAVLYAEEALARGKPVTLQIHPRHGVILTLGVREDFPGDPYG